MLRMSVALIALMTAPVVAQADVVGQTFPATLAGHAVIAPNTIIP